MTCTTSAASTALLCERRRHAGQGARGRERRARRLARGREGLGGGARPAALALARRPVGARAAGADDERHQRRRACRQRARPAGVHARPARRRDASPRRCASAARSTTRSRRGCTRDGLSTAVGDEGGFAPEIASAEAAIELILAAAGDAGHGDAVGIALDPAMTELYRDGAYHRRGPRAERRAARGVVDRPLRRATRSSRSRTRWPRTTGTAGASSPSSSARACSSSATTSS